MSEKLNKALQSETRDRQRLSASRVILNLGMFSEVTEDAASRPIHL